MGRIFKLKVNRDKCEELLNELEQDLKLSTDQCTKTKFHFVDGILYRDHYDGVAVFKERSLEFNILRNLILNQAGTRITHDMDEIDAVKWKPVSDAALRINEKIEIKFGIKDFIEINYPDKYIVIHTEMSD